MDEELEHRLLNWPATPKERTLYVDESPSKELLISLEEKGWKVVDIRLMPNDTNAEKADVIKAKLEGINIGTINADARALKYTELQARMLGMLNVKQGNEAIEKLNKGDDLEAMLMRWGESKHARGTRSKPTVKKRKN